MPFIIIVHITVRFGSDIAELEFELELGAAVRLPESQDGLLLLKPSS